MGSIGPRTLVTYQCVAIQDAIIFEDIGRRSFPSATPFRPSFVHLSPYLVPISLRTSSYLRKMPLFHLKKLQPKSWQRLRQWTKTQINPQTNGGAPAGNVADTTTVSYIRERLPSSVSTLVRVCLQLTLNRNKGVSQSIVRPTVGVDEGWRASATNTPNVRFTYYQRQVYYLLFDFTAGKWPFALISASRESREGLVSSSFSIWPRYWSV